MAGNKSNYHSNGANHLFNAVIFVQQDNYKKVSNQISLTQLINIPGDVDVTVILEVVVNTPGSRHTCGGCHLDVNNIVHLI